MPNNKLQNLKNPPPFYRPERGKITIKGMFEAKKSKNGPKRAKKIGIGPTKTDLGGYPLDGAILFSII